MERINLGFKLLKENLWLWLAPLGLNFIGYVLGIATKSLKLVPHGFHIKFSVPNGLPDISNILQQPQVQGFQIEGSPTLFIVFILLGPFLAGGFLGSIFNLLKGSFTDKDFFWEQCKHYFLRLLAVNIISFLLFMVVLVLAFLIFPLFGLIGLIFIIYLTYFWQMALVYHDSEILESFNQGKEFFKNNFSVVIGLLLLLAVCSGILSIPLNIIAQDLIGYGIAIVIWSFFGTIFSIAIMSLFNDLTKIEGNITIGDTPPLKP